MLKELLFVASLLASTVDQPPVLPVQVLAPFRAPTSTYGPGHRGVDLVAPMGTAVAAPIAGVVSFAGRVAGKDVITITDGRRVVSMEPVSAAVPAGTAVTLGQLVGTAGAGGHCAGRCVHLGLRIDGRYVASLIMHARLVP